MILYNNACYGIPLNFIMKPLNCNLLGNCNCFQQCIQPCFQHCFKISLTITGLNTYTFTIIDQNQSQIAQGTAVLFGNILQLTFSNGCYANIVFENYNIERIGYMSVCGLYIFNGIYQIVPSLCC
jgi:hypothetical protein